MREYKENLVKKLILTSLILTMSGLLIFSWSQETLPSGTHSDQLNLNDQFGSNKSTVFLASDWSGIISFDNNCIKVLNKAVHCDGVLVDLFLNMADVDPATIDAIESTGWYKQNNFVSNSNKLGTLRKIWVSSHRGSMPNSGATDKVPKYAREFFHG
jgi:hypothetical protein